MPGGEKEVLSNPSSEDRRKVKAGGRRGKTHFRTKGTEANVRKKTNAKREKKGKGREIRKY